MELTWKTKAVTIYVSADQSYSDLSLNGQHWLFTVTPHSALPEDPPADEVDVTVSIKGIKTETEARKLCELIWEAVSE